MGFLLDQNTISNGLETSVSKFVSRPFGMLIQAFQLALRPSGRPKKPQSKMAPKQFFTKASWMIFGKMHFWPTF